MNAFVECAKTMLQILVSSDSKSNFVEKKLLSNFSSIKCVHGLMQVSLFTFLCLAKRNF